MTDTPADPQSEQNGPVAPFPRNRSKEVAFGIYLVLLHLGLLHCLYSIWPQRDPQATGMIFGIWGPITGAESRYLLLVIFAGALGSYIHLATSFADYAGYGKLNWNWGWWFLLRPFIGTALAVIMYCVIRGGLITGFGGDANTASSNAVSQLNPFGMAAVAGMTGMFSKQATDKLREVFETMFGVNDARPHGLSDDDPGRSGTG